MSNSTVIGTTSSFYGVATFQSQPIITSTILANNDNSTNIATTAWANSFLTYAQTQPNTWTGAQTFTTANVSVLNVFKTSVDTINASSITSDMTIGANLNGGSLTIGTANSTTSIRGTTNITSGTINASYFKLYSGVIDGKQSVWLDTIQSNLTPNMHIGFNNASEIYIGSSKTNTIGIGGDAGSVRIANNGLVAGARVSIATGTNATNTEMTLGSTTLSYNNIRGNIIHIADTGLSATGKVHIASGVNGGNATGSEIYMGSTTLSKCFIRGVDVNINHTVGGSIYMGSDTAGSTNILGHVNIGALSTATGNIIIGNNSAPGYTLIDSKGITMNRFLGDGQYIDIAAQANTTTGYTILGSGNLQNNYIRGRNVNINSDVTGNTYVGNTTGESKMFGSNVYIHGSVLYVNSNSDGLGHSRIQLINYGTYIYADTPLNDTHRIKFFLRNFNVFQIVLDYNGNQGGSSFRSRFGFTTDGGLGDFAEMFEWEDQNPENEKRVGYSVVVNERGLIRKATIEDNPNDIIGVVSATATVTGSAAAFDWNKKYLKDDFEQNILDSSGNPMINPDFDESVTYRPRGERKEWATIGLYGKLIVRNECPINPKWRLIGTRQTARIYLA